MDEPRLQTELDELLMSFILGLRFQQILRDE